MEIKLFTHRDLARFKRHHWQTHKEGRATLRWVRVPTTDILTDDNDGHWAFSGPQGNYELPGNVDLETVNLTWDRYAAVANGQVLGGR